MLHISYDGGQESHDDRGEDGGDGLDGSGVADVGGAVAHKDPAAVVRGLKAGGVLAEVGAGQTGPLLLGLVL